MILSNDDDDDLDDGYDGNKQARTCAAPPSSVHSVCSPPFTLHRNIALGIATTTASLAHCCTIFLKSSGYRHRNPNINIREIIWLGNQLSPNWHMPDRSVCVKYEFPLYPIFAADCFYSRDFHTEGACFMLY